MELLKVPHIVNMIEEIKFLEITLRSVFNRTQVLPDGSVIEIRVLVDQVNNLKIIIHPNEHAPPHFHVKSDSFDASISVEDCLCLKGNIESKDLKKIQYWHTLHKNELIDAWNRTRPDDCPVGRIEK